MASKLCVGGLSYSTTSASLRDYFARCGTIVSATVITDRVTGQSRGFGFVEMSTQAPRRKPRRPSRAWTVSPPRVAG